MLLYQIVAVTIRRKTWRNSCSNDKFKISSSRKSEKFDIPDGSCFVSDIKYYLSI